MQVFYSIIYCILNIFLTEMTNSYQLFCYIYLLTYVMIIQINNPLPKLKLGNKSIYIYIHVCARTSVFLLSMKMLTKVFFSDGTMENSLTIFPFTVLVAFFRSADGMEVNESLFVTMKCC